MSGGSSSGPAVAVALGACALGLGTDTTGSLRVPVAVCGVVAIRLAHGVVPVDGVVPLAPAYDTVGPLAATAADAALALGVPSNDADLTAWATDRPAPAERPDGTRVGVMSAWHHGRCDDAVASAFAAVLAALRHRGAEIVQNDLPELEDIEQTHMIVQLSAAFASHAPWFAEQRQHYSPAVLGRLERGAGYAAELIAERDRHRVRVAAAIDTALDGVEAIAMLAAPRPAPPLDAKVIELGDEPRELRLALLALAIPQATGPTVALPMGRQGGLPFGLHIHGRAGRDQQLLALALAAEAIL